MEWEYKVIQVRVNDWHELSIAERDLRKYGRDGWELVAVIRPNENFDCVCFLKKEKYIDPSKREES